MNKAKNPRWRSNSWNFQDVHENWKCIHKMTNKLKVLLPSSLLFATKPVTDKKLLLTLLSFLPKTLALAKALPSCSSKKHNSAGAKVVFQFIDQSPACFPTMTSCQSCVTSNIPQWSPSYWLSSPFEILSTSDFHLKQTRAKNLAIPGRTLAPAVAQCCCFRHESWRNRTHRAFRSLRQILWIADGWCNLSELLAATGSGDLICSCRHHNLDERKTDAYCLRSGVELHKL